MIWRVLSRNLLEGVLWVVVMMVLLIIVAVGVERGPAGWAPMMESILLHVLIALVWLGPLMCGMGILLALLRMKSRGELLALQAMGVGPRQITPIAVSIGVLMAVLGWILSEWCVPGLYEINAPTWVWTDFGPWHSGSGVLFQLSDGSQIQLADQGVEWLARSEPRLAAWSTLRWDGSVAEQTELWARPSRLLSCIGFSLVGLTALRTNHSFAVLVGSGVVVLVVDVLTWTMGAQGQVTPVLAGTVSAWSWVFICLAIWIQSSTRIHRPL